MGHEVTPARGVACTIDESYYNNSKTHTTKSKRGIPPPAMLVRLLLLCGIAAAPNPESSIGRSMAREKRNRRMTTVNKNPKRAIPRSAYPSTGTSIAQGGEAGEGSGQPGTSYGQDGQSGSGESNYRPSYPDELHSCSTVEECRILLRHHTEFTDVTDWILVRTRHPSGIGEQNEWVMDHLVVPGCLARPPPQVRKPCRGFCGGKCGGSIGHEPTQEPPKKKIKAAPTHSGGQPSPRPAAGEVCCYCKLPCGATCGLQSRGVAEEYAVPDAPAQQEEARGRERPRRSVKKVNYAVDLDLITGVPGVPNFYIAENLARSKFKKAGIEEVVTVGDSRDLPYEGWQGRVDFRFPDGDLNESDLVKVQAAKQHCIAELLKGKAVAVHCAAGVNRSSLVAVLVMQDMNEQQSAQEAIQSLTSAKLAVNPSWLTLTNGHFRAHLLQNM